MILLPLKKFSLLHLSAVQDAVDVLYESLVGHLTVVEEQDVVIGRE